MGIKEGSMFNLNRKRSRSFRKYCRALDLQFDDIKAFASFLIYEKDKKNKTNLNSTVKANKVYENNERKPINRQAAKIAGFKFKK